MSDTLERTEKLIQEARALLAKAQASLDESDQFHRSLGIDNQVEKTRELMERASPEEVALAERLAQERIAALEAEARARLESNTQHPPGPAEVPRRRKFRRMV